MTLDGKIATRTGNSQWITGKQSREHVHWLRAGSDAIMVGSGTVRTDDPQLTTRTSASKGGDAIRVIVDGDASMSPASRMLNMESSAPTLIAVMTTACADRKSLLEKAGAELLEIEPKDGKVDLEKLAIELGKRGIASVLIEGGGGLLAAAFDARIIDKTLFFVAPKIIGGEKAPTPVEGVGVETLDQAIGLENLSASEFGNDLLIEGYVVK
jgi:diaminohydroxyphosphoribosylaminopyrimidine deaminase/5-amino-6-(5-phosphoribosylamino)uracil reductase